MKRKLLQYKMMIGMVVGFMTSYAQPHTAQWPFYLAFEDATGATDTLWLVKDQDATFPGLDPQFGEVPIILSETDFNVWLNIFENDGDYDCFALPMWGSLGQFILANNFELPMTITWDSTLFNADILYQMFGTGMEGALMDNNYFPPDVGFNMLETNYVVLPYFEIQGSPGNHFPLFVTITLDPNTISVKNVGLTNISIHPNPVESILNIETTESFHSIEIRNLGGKLISQQNLHGELKFSRDVSELPSGMYFVIVHGPNGRGAVKFVKK